MSYTPGLRIYRRVGEEIIIHPVLRPETVTIVQITSASSDGVTLQTTWSDGVVETDTLIEGGSIVFGEGKYETILILDSAGGGHATFRALAGPDVRVQRVEKGTRK